jgi:hypothetical protein
MSILDDSKGTSLECALGDSDDSRGVELLSTGCAFESVSGPPDVLDTGNDFFVP